MDNLPEQQVVSSPITSSSSESPSYSKKMLFTAVGFLFLALYTAAIVFGMWYIAKKDESKKPLSVVPRTQQDAAVIDSTLSGVIDLNGTPSQNTYIAITQREVGNQNFGIVDTNIPAIDGATWQWTGAKSGTEYEIKALLFEGNTQLSQSQSLIVTAPADTEVLRINIPAIIPQPTPILTAISGTVNINGYIPQGTSVTIMQRKTGTAQFTQVASLSAIDNNIWSWTQALQNQTYDIQAILSGTQVTSNTITVTAPASGEVLTINSSLTPPAPSPTTISGTINFNGSIPENSYLTLGIRKTGVIPFTPVDGKITAIDGAPWSWNQALSGTSYDVQAYIWTNNIPANQSNIQTISAPATGETLTINLQQAPNTKPLQNSLTTSCVGKNPATGLWQASILYNANAVLQNPRQYALIVTSSGTSNQYVNTAFSPDNPNQTQTFTTGFVFSEGVLYNAQYAYATCANCNAFSPFSQSVQFTCTSALPANTPIPSTAPTTKTIPIL